MKSRMVFHVMVLETINGNMIYLEKERMQLALREDKIKTMILQRLMSGKRRGSHKLAIPGNLLPVGRATVVVGNGSLAVHGSGGSGARRDFK